MKRRLIMLAVAIAVASGWMCWLVWGYRDGTWPTEVVIWLGLLAIVSMVTIIYRLFWALWLAWSEPIEITLESDNG